MICCNTISALLATPIEPVAPPIPQTAAFNKAHIESTSCSFLTDFIKNAVFSVKNALISIYATISYGITSLYERCFTSFMPNSYQTNPLWPKTLQNPGQNCFMNAFLQNFLDNPERMSWFKKSLQKIANDETLDVNPYKGMQHADYPPLFLDLTLKEAAEKTLGLLETWQTTSLSGNQGIELRFCLIKICCYNPQFEGGYIDLKTLTTSIPSPSHTLPGDYRSLENALIQSIITLSKETTLCQFEYAYIEELSSSNNPIPSSRRIIQRTLLISKVPRENGKCICNLAGEIHAFFHPEGKKTPLEGNRFHLVKRTLDGNLPDSLIYSICLPEDLSKVEFQFTDLDSLSLDILISGKEKTRYTLQSCALHTGNHLYTYKKDQKKEIWYKCNDGYVGEVDSSHIKGLMSGKSSSDGIPISLIFNKKHEKIS